jgi:hypothetical protein
LSGKAVVESLAVGPTLAFGAMHALLKAWSFGAFRALKAAGEASGNKAQTEASTKLTFSGL